MKRVPMYESAAAARKGFVTELTAADRRAVDVAVRSRSVEATSDEEVDRARERLASFMREIAS